MKSPSGVSRRIEQAVLRLQARDPEGALVNLFPAIDKTAKKRRPRDGVGRRIKAFLKDEEVLITAIGMGGVFRNCSFDGMSFEDALYKFGRTSIAHEGELDPMLSFSERGAIKIGVEGWILPIQYISGMSLAVVVAKENAGEAVDDSLGVNVFGRLFRVNELWGDGSQLRSHICELFQDANLFT